MDAGRKAEPSATAPARPRRVGDAVAIAGDYQYRALTEGPRVQRFWHETKLWLVRRYLDPRPTDRVLDVGCGSGVVAAALADAPVRSCLGIDGNPDAIAFATAQFPRPNLQFRQCLVDELDLPDGSFDAVCCFELLEHIYADQGRALLASLFRLVRPGGRLLLTTPNYRSLWPLIERALDRSGKAPKLADDQHVTFYNHGLLRRQWEAAGWRPAKLRSCCTLAPWLAALSPALARGVRPLESRAPFGTILVHALVKPSAALRPHARAAVASGAAAGRSS